MFVGALERLFQTAQQTWASFGFLQEDFIAHRIHACRAKSKTGDCPKYLAGSKLLRGNDKPFAIFHFMQARSSECKIFIHENINEVGRRFALRHHLIDTNMKSFRVHRKPQTNFSVQSSVSIKLREEFQDGEIEREAVCVRARRWTMDYLIL